MTAVFHQSCSLCAAALAGCVAALEGAFCPPATSAPAPENRTMAHTTMLFETHLVQCIAFSSSAPAAHESGNGVTQPNYHIRAGYGCLPRHSSMFIPVLRLPKQPGAPAIRALCGWVGKHEPRTRY